MTSFRDVNYSLRPAKAVERKMMVEAFRRLEAAWPLSEYRYVGLGSIYFADFLLIHRLLGISEMISLEKSIGDKVRFDFNRPYRCVEIRYGTCAELLPALPWDRRSIMWLDYDSILDTEAIADLKSTVQNIPTGSLVIISVNVMAPEMPRDITVMADQVAWRLNQFTGNVGAANVPHGTTGDLLRQKDLPTVCWRVLNDAVAGQVTARNGRADLRPDTIQAQQIMHFSYSDGAPMLTVGWLIHTRADAELVQKCDFGSLPFYRPSSEPLLIQAPKLTPKEIRHLTAALPENSPLTAETARELMKQTGVPEHDIQKFAAVYRHYPHYAEVAL